MSSFNQRLNFTRLLLHLPAPREVLHHRGIFWMENGTWTRLCRRNRILPWKKTSGRLSAKRTLIWLAGRPTGSPSAFRRKGLRPTCRKLPASRVFTLRASTTDARSFVSVNRLHRNCSVSAILRRRPEPNERPVNVTGSKYAWEEGDSYHANGSDGENL